MKTMKPKFTIALLAVGINVGAASAMTVSESQSLLSSGLMQQSSQSLGYTNQITFKSDLYEYWGRADMGSMGGQRQMDRKFYTGKTLAVDGLGDPTVTTYPNFTTENDLANKNGWIIIVNGGCIGYCPGPKPEPKPEPEDKGRRTFASELDLINLHRGIERKWSPLETEKLRNGVKFHLGNKVLVSTSMFEHVATLSSAGQENKAVKLTPNWLPGGADLSVYTIDSFTTAPYTWVSQ